MKTSVIRQAFLDYFESKGHEGVYSSSLIPNIDTNLDLIRGYDQY